MNDPESPLVQTELKRLNGELKSLEASIRSLEQADQPGKVISLEEVSTALQRLDPVWDILYPEERRRVLELLVENITVSKSQVQIRFRANGLEQIVDELSPMIEDRNGKEK